MALLDAMVRSYRPGDEDAAYFVCLKTGDHGKDGGRFYRKDPQALGRIYVGPYLKFEPELALLLEDSAGICGYALGALDSRSFYDLYERLWRPQLCTAYPAPTGDPSQWNRIERVYHLYHNPDYTLPLQYDSYPSHVHIDLLPRVQGRGYGRRMMERLLELLESRGSPGVHLWLSAKNDRAHGFYRALGFAEFVRRGRDGSICMGRRLSAADSSNPAGT
jgi:GNAT superfamily N-acetyltransferase